MKDDNTRVSEYEFEMKAEYDFSTGVRGRFYQPAKTATTVLLDDDIIRYFQKMAGEKKVNFQALVNAALREYVEGHATD